MVPQILIKEKIERIRIQPNKVLLFGVFIPKCYCISEYYSWFFMIYYLWAAFKFVYLICLGNAFEKTLGKKVIHFETTLMQHSKIIRRY